MTRRRFLGLLAGLPLMGRFVRKPEPEQVPRHYDFVWTYYDPERDLETTTDGVRVLRHEVRYKPLPVQPVAPWRFTPESLKGEGWPVEWVSPEEMRRRYPPA